MSQVTLAQCSSDVSSTGFALAGDFSAFALLAMQYDITAGPFHDRHVTVCPTTTAVGRVRPFVGLPESVQVCMHECAVPVVLVSLCPFVLSSVVTILSSVVCCLLSVV